MNDTEVVEVDDAERAETEAGIAATREGWTFQKSLYELEQAIRKCDAYALYNRWASGKLLLGERRGKRLGDGVLARYAEYLKVSTSELSSRQKFAEKFPERCPTQAELHTYVESRRPPLFNGDRPPERPRHHISWNAIRTTLLTDNPRTKKEPNVSELLKDAHKNLRRVVNLDKTAEDLATLAMMANLIEDMTTDREYISTALRARTGGDFHEETAPF